MSMTERRSFTVGETAELSRTITNEDIVAFAAVSHDTNPVHLDDEYAHGSYFKGRVAHGMFGASIISALLGTRLPGPGAIYLKQDLQFRAAIRPGETITARATVTAWDAERGRVQLHTEVLGDGGTTKIVGDALLVLTSFLKPPASSRAFSPARPPHPYHFGRFMIGFLRKAKRGVEARLQLSRDKKRMAHLYAPEPSDLDVERHRQEAMNWLMRAQDAGTDRGVSYGVQFGSDFDLSYPETTGYICQTFVEQAELTGNADLLRRAVDMGDWEAAVQLPDGAVMGGKFNTKPTPAVFNTGMVLLGWSALIRKTNEERFRAAARRASDWLLAMQEPDGNWIRGNSKFAAAGMTLYNVKAAWGLCEAGLALGDDRCVKAAVKNAEFCLAQQHPNGWLPNCCLSDPIRPLLHTLAYSMQGLFWIGKLTKRDDLIAGARKLADAELRILGPDGFLPGRQDAQFRSAVDYCCLTGSAQTSSIWSELFLLTGDEKYREGVTRIDRYLMAHHDIRNPDLRLRGGLAGSWPVWGEYAAHLVLNWATKFLVDALSGEQRIAKR